jgi:hypothetical protein
MSTNAEGITAMVADLGILAHASCLLAGHHPWARLALWWGLNTGCYQDLNVCRHKYWDHLSTDQAKQAKPSARRALSGGGGSRAPKQDQQIGQHMTAPGSSLTSVLRHGIAGLQRWWAGVHIPGQQQPTSQLEESLAS